MAEIVLDRLCKRYSEQIAAVHDASFTINDGEFFILVGPSGCGKSSLLNMIVGLENITSGTLYMDGKTINQADPKDRNMAMVFQSYALYPHMTVQKNLEFPLKLAKLTKAEINSRVLETARMLELTELLQRKPVNLSGGQRQRVAMGRALVRRPKVFLLDEPLSNLDAKLRIQMRAEIAKLQKCLGITTIYVTHDQTEAMILGDRVAVLCSGRVQQVGTPRQLYEKPANRFVAGFIGSPPMNFFSGCRLENCLLTPFGKLRVTETIHEQQHRPLIVGLRPEHIRLSNDQDKGFTFMAKVVLCEWLGSEMYLQIEVPAVTAIDNNLNSTNGDSMSFASISLTARLLADSNISEGQVVNMSFDPDRLHFFDAETERALNDSMFGQ